jgi:outer membrane protein
MERNARPRGAVARVILYCLLSLFPCLAQPIEAAAQQPVGGAPTLTLEEALRLAEGSSEQVAVAAADVKRAEGERYRARSEYFPQIYASLGYTRTLASEFESISGGGADTTQAGPSEPCGRFAPNPALPLEERVDSLESALECAAATNPFAAFSDLPFGRENQYNLGLTLSQTVFSGGRVQAQNRVASSGREVAEIGLISSRAQLMLDVAQAYYDAALSDRLVEIAEATLTQAESTLRQVRVAREVGEQPEFELLRAQVTRDTQEPVVIQRRADRDLAYLRLKQLLDLPADVPVDLQTELGEEELAPVVTLVSDVLGVDVDTTVDARAPVRQAAENVDIQEDLRTVAASQRLPSLSVSSSYGRVGYPDSGLPTWNDFRTNWTVTASAQVPIFTGGRIRGDVMVAEANLDEARARLEQTRELAALDTRSAHERLEAARATWQASSGTVGQADRAYEIADIRFREGISTQLELNDSRILLQQAQANRAVAARDLQVARLRVALLPFLPIGGDAAGGQGAAGQNGMQTQQQLQQQQRRATPQQTTPGTGTIGTGGVRAAAQGGGGNR